MEYRVEQKQKSTILYVTGSIKTDIAPSFQERLLEEIGRTTNLLVDLAGVEYICSAGLRAFLAGQRLVDENDKEMTLINVNDEVMDVFSETGFDSVLNIR